MNGTSTLDRIAQAVPETRRAFDLSQRQIAAMAGVPPHTISRLKRGRFVDPAHLLRLAACLLVIDLYAGSSVFDDDVDVLHATASQEPWAA